MVNKDVHMKETFFCISVVFVILLMWCVSGHGPLSQTDLIKLCLIWENEPERHQVKV